MNLSLRARATLYLSGLVSLLLAAFAFILISAVTASLERDFRLQMQRDADLLTELFKEELRLKALNEFREEAAELGVNLRVLDAKGGVLFQSRVWGETLASVDIPAPPAELSEVWSDVPVGRIPHSVISRRVEIEPYQPFVLQMAQPKNSSIEARRKMIHWSLELIPFMLLLSIAAGYFFAGKMLAPLHALRLQADALNPEDLSARIPYPPIRDEIYLLTDRLNRALGRIEEAFNKLKVFAADASHELRIPLTAMRGTLELALRRERSPDEYRTALAEALEEAEHLSRVTSDLLALTRADAGEKTLRRVATEWKPFLERCVKDFLDAHPGLNIRLHALPDCRLSIDPDQMDRVLINLFDNALKYAGADAPIDVKAETNDTHLRVTVADQGPGIAQEDQGRIFDRFYRANKSRAQGQSGSGLGLAIASSIVRAHRGALRLKSSTSSGSVFEITLPLEKSNVSLMPG